jgi:MFS family permease
LGRPLWIFSAATTISLTGGFIQEIAVGLGSDPLDRLAGGGRARGPAADTDRQRASRGADRSFPAGNDFWASQVASCLQALVLCALAALGELTVGGLLACAVFLGTCNAFTLPARLAYMTALTPREGFGRAVVLYSLGGNAAFFAGPLIAGALISAFGVGAAFAANALAYLPMIAVAMTLPAIAAKPTASRQRQGVLQQMRGGFVHAAQNRAILVPLLSFAALAGTARGVIELAPSSIAATALGGGVGTLSLLSSAVALGALLAGLWMSRWGMSRWVGWRECATIITTLAGSAAALLAYGASGEVALALAGAVLLGVMLAINNISVSNAIQLNAEPCYRGRINSLYNMIFKGGPALGVALFGGLAQLTDVRLSSVVAAIVLVLLMLWITRQGRASPAASR